MGIKLYCPLFLAMLLSANIIASRLEYYSVTCDDETIVNETIVIRWMEYGDCDVTLRLNPSPLYQFNYLEIDRTEADVCVTVDNDWYNMCVPVTEYDFSGKTAITIRLQRNYYEDNHLFTVRKNKKYNELCDLISLDKEVSASFENGIIIFRPENTWKLAFEIDTGSKRAIENPLEYTNYVVEMVRHNALTASACFNYSVVLPTWETPSNLPSDNAYGTNWKSNASVINGSFLNRIGYIYTLRKFAKFETISDKLQMEKVCLVIEYYLTARPNPDGINVMLVAYATSDEEVLLYAGKIATNDTLQWKEHRILADVPKNAKRVKLRVTLENSEGMYISKLLGCNPDAYESRTILETNVTRMPVLTHSSLSTKCENGGAYINNKCYCPPGFDGSNCQKVCGHNRWGKGCRYHCSGTKFGCMNMIFCLYEGHCTCPTGYSGPFCNLACDKGSWGAGCAFSCGMCQGDSGCDRYTGYCTNSCKSGYVPPLCINRYVHLSVGPMVVQAGNYAEVSTTILNISGHGTPSYFRIEYKNDGDSEWNFTKIESINNDGKISGRITNLSSGVHYQTRIILFTQDLNFYDHESIPFTSFLTECHLSQSIKMTVHIMKDSAVLVWTDDSNVEDMTCPLALSEVQINWGGGWQSTESNKTDHVFMPLTPGITYRARVRQISEDGRRGEFSNIVQFKTDESSEIWDMRTNVSEDNTVTVTWNTDEETIDETSFNVTYSCIFVITTGQFTPCWDDAGQLTVSGTRMAVLFGLRPFRRYWAAVQNMEKYSQVVSFTTYPKEPEVSPINGRVHKVTNTTALVSWSRPDDCLKCNGIITGFNYHLKWTDEGGNPMSVNPKYTKNNTVLLSELRPSTNYTLEIYLRNTAGYDQSHKLEINFTTAPNVPGPVRELTVYKMSRQSVGLRWAAPAAYQPAGLKSFTVSVFGGRRYTHDPQPCLPWPAYYCYTITNLRSDTTYNISVSARNVKVDEDGEPAYVTARTKEGSPGKPENLVVNSVEANKIVLTWDLPKFLNGSIRYFLIKLEHTSSYKEDDCCRDFPKQELQVTEEKRNYSIELTGLPTASTYALSVMAETVWIGESSRLTVSTRPPPGWQGHLPQLPNYLFTNDESLEITWDNITAETDTSSDYAGLIVDTLVVVVEVENEEEEQEPTENILDLIDLRIDNKCRKSKIKDDYIASIVKNAIGTNYFVASRYEQGAVTIDLSGESDVTTIDSSIVDEICNNPLTSGRVYKLALVQITAYMSLYNAAIISSATFIA